jgi:hypothetical protein
MSISPRITIIAFFTCLVFLYGAKADEENQSGQHATYRLVSDQGEAAEDPSDTIVVDGVSFSKAAVNDVIEKARKEFAKDPRFAGNQKLIDNAARTAAAAAMVTAAAKIRKEKKDTAGHQGQ